MQNVFYFLQIITLFELNYSRQLLIKFMTIKKYSTFFFYYFSKKKALCKF